MRDEGGTKHQQCPGDLSRQAMAPREGLEPPICGIEVRCRIRFGDRGTKSGIFLFDSRFRYQASIKYLVASDGFEPST